MKCWKRVSCTLTSMMLLAGVTAAQQPTSGWSQGVPATSGGSQPFGYSAQRGYGMQNNGGSGYGASNYAGQGNAAPAYAGRGYNVSPRFAGQNYGSQNPASQTFGGPNAAARNYVASQPATQNYANLQPAVRNFGGPTGFVPAYGAPSTATRNGYGQATRAAYSSNAPYSPVGQSSTRLASDTFGGGGFGGQGNVNFDSTLPAPGTSQQMPNGGIMSRTPEFQSGPAVSTQVYTGAPVDGGIVGQGGQACGDCDWGPPVVPCCQPTNNCPKFFGGIYGLIMDREDSDEVCFAVDPHFPSRMYLSSREASMDAAGGFEVVLGKTFDCCRYGLEFVYWQLFPDDESASVMVDRVPAESIYPTPDYRDVWLNFTGGADTVSNYFNNGSLRTIEIRRNFDYYNLELNLLSGPLGPTQSCCCDPCGGGSCGGCDPCAVRPYGGNCGQQPRWQAGWLLGVRYFSIDEGFMLAMDNGDGLIDYTYNGGDNEFYHQIDTSNDLVGVQLGMKLNYCVSKCLTLDFGSKFGVYGNHMTMYQRAFNSNGPGFVAPSSPSDFTIDTDEDDVAFLGDLRAGVGYRIGCHWRLTGGYRMVAASNVALPLHQLPVGRQFASYDKLNRIQHDASLVLHGAYFGAEFAW